MTYLFLICLLVSIASLVQVNSQYSETEAKSYIEYLNDAYNRLSHEFTVAEWNYASNINNETLAEKLKKSSESAKFFKSEWPKTLKFPWRTYEDANLRRQFQKFSRLGVPALPDAKYDEYDKIVTEMQTIYSTAKVCDYYNSTKCDLSLEPELTTILANSRNESELKHAWVEWRKASGKKVRSLFEQYVSLLNEAARLNNVSDASELWLDDYETPDIQEQAAKLFEQLKPFYAQLHAYVRRKLREQYGEEIVSKRGLIPAHLLGNMWSQTWDNIIDITNPFPDAKSENVTAYLLEQNYTAIKMFKLAEEFFTSINLSPMSDSFWQNSILEKPADRELVCHASAWDFYDGEDFRIKQCSEITEEDLMVAHHEMGHIEYFMQYKDQPFIYKEGANPGFHEAIGDTIALSVSSIKHLKRIGIIKNSTIISKETELSQLFSKSSGKVAFLPFSFLMDLWRWNVFKGNIKPANYNCEWWKLRMEYQGVAPPVKRSEEDFDAGAKYHVVANVPYFRYFISYIIQFQFQQVLCEKAGEFDPHNPTAKPLHQCDIYKSTEAGNALKRMLQMGASKPWQDAMEVLTGKRNMDANALLQYFAPIYEWLKNDNEKFGEYIGWEIQPDVCASY